MAPLPARYVVVLVCFCAAFTCYMDRVGFPLAYTVMAKVPPLAQPVWNDCIACHPALRTGSRCFRKPG